MRHRGRVALLGVLGCIALVACGDDSDDQTGATDGTGTTAGTATTETRPDEEPTTLRISMSDPAIFPVTGIIELADRQGWWADEGIEIELLIGSGADNLRVMQSGSSDLAIVNPESATQAALADPDGVTLIGTYYDHNIYSWYTFDPDVEFDDAVLGTTNAGGDKLVLQAYLADNPDSNMTPREVGGLGENRAALDQGDIDGAVSTPPFLDQALAEGARILVSGSDLVGDVPADIIAVNASYAEEHGDVLEGFWRVIERGFEFYTDNPEEAADALSEFMPAEREHILSSLTGDNASGWHINQDTAVYCNVASLLSKSGLVTEPIDWSELVDQQFLPENARTELEGDGCA